MNIVKKNIPAHIHDIYILPLADLHIGENACDMNYIQKLVNIIKENENYYTILNGDLIDNAIRTSIGDVYSQTMSPKDQIKQIAELLKPIKDKILAITNGNHEERTYRDSGIDLMEDLAVRLDLEEAYCNESAYIFVKLYPYNGTSTSMVFTIYATHGRGGGRKEGAKAIRLADMANITDADVYIHSHTHLPMTMKNKFYRSDVQHKALLPVEHLFVNTGSTLDYAKYAEKNEFKPSSKSMPLIHLYAEDVIFTKGKGCPRKRILLKRCDAII